MKYIFINHGFMGSNIENWFPWLKKQLDDENTQVVIPQYPIDSAQHFYNEWEKILDIYKNFNYIKNDSILIAHSSGCVFTIKYLLKNKIKIDKLILVSGFNNYYSNDVNDFHNKVNKTFYVSDNELGNLKNFTNEIICIYGDNDPFIPQVELQNFANKLSARSVIIKNGGHLNETAGFIKFEEILNYIK